MTDGFGRNVNYLRMSVTELCNLRCRYCMPAEGVCKKEHAEMLTEEEMITAVEAAASLGITKLRITGGEPLVKKNILSICRRAAQVAGIRELALTTNGVLLPQFARPLREAGVERVNISLDTLNPQTYRCITKKDYLEQVKAGIRSAVEVGLYPVKLNMVVMKGINDQEIWDMFHFCRDQGVILQLIELLQTENCTESDFFDEYHYDMNGFEKELKELSDRVKKRPFMQDRKKYFLEGGEIEVVRPMDNTKFCQNCTRLRITPEGKIKPCLLRNDNLVDLIEPMRRGYSDEQLKELFLEAIDNREPYFQETPH